MGGSIQVILLLPLAVLVLLTVLQWSLLLWAESTTMAATQNPVWAIAVLRGSAKDGREVGGRVLFNSTLGGATVRVDYAATFTTAIVERTTIQIPPMMNVTVHQAAKVPIEQIW